MPAVLEIPKNGALQDVNPAALQRLTMPADVQVQPPSEDASTGDVTFWATVVDKTATPNRNGFVFDWRTPEDVKLSNFLKNPVMLYAHDSFRLPIGRWEKVEVTDRRVRMFGRIPGGPDYADLKAIRVRIRDGYLKATSIGFYVLDWDEVRDQESGEPLAIRVKSFEIVECSPCSIGAHPSAVIGQGAEPSEAMKAFLAAGTGTWDEQNLYDTENGGIHGKLFRLSPAPSESGAADGSEAPAPDEAGGDGYRTEEALKAAVQAAEDLTRALQRLLAQVPSSGARALLGPSGPAHAEPEAQDRGALLRGEALLRQEIRRVLNKPDLVRIRAAQARAIVRAIGERNRRGRFNTNG